MPFGFLQFPKTDQGISLELHVARGDLFSLDDSWHGDTAAEWNHVAGQMQLTASGKPFAAVGHPCYEIGAALDRDNILAQPGLRWARLSGFTQELQNGLIRP